MRKQIMILLALLVALVGLPTTAMQAEELSTQQKFDVLKQKGIFTGFSDGSARLNDRMSREQFAAVLFRLWELKEEPSSPSYDDVLKTRWSFGEIQAVTRAGLMKGEGHRKFSPKANVTVEQLAVVLIRAYGLAGEGSSKVSGKVSSWARNSVSHALDKKFISVRSDYTVPATRGLLVEAAYAVYVEMLGGAPLNIKFVVPISSYGVWIQLNDSVQSIDKKRFAIKDSSGKSLSVNQAELSGGGKEVRITTDWQNPGTTYTLFVDGNSVATFQGYYNPPPADTTKPSIASFVRQPNGIIEIIFTEQVEKTSATKISNYSINNGLGIRSVQLSNDHQKVSITTGKQNPETTYKLTVKGVKDLAGNVMDTRSDLAFNGSNDQTKPTVKSVTSETGRSVRVVFSEKVRKDTAESPGNYSVNNGLSITAAVLGSDGVTVTLYTTDQKEGTLYNMTVQGVADLVGNVMDKRSNLYFAGIEDRKKPTVLSVSVNANATLTVKFNEKVTEQTAENRTNYSIDKGLTVTDAQLEPDGLTVTLFTSAQQDASVYTITIAGVTDLSGNVMTSVSWTFGGVIDRTPPTITSVAASGNDKVTLTFSERLDRASAENRSFYSIDGGIGTPAAAVYDDAKRTVTLTTGAQKAGQIYYVTVNSVKDLGGQTIAANTRLPFVGIGTSPGSTISFESVRAVNDNTIELTFSRTLTNTDVTGLRAAIVSDNGANVSMSGWKFFTQRSVDNERKVTIQFRTENNPNPSLFKPGHVYVAQVVGIAGLNTEGNANRKTFAGTENRNQVPYVTKVQPLNNTAIKVIFNEPVKNVTGTAFRIRSQDGQTIDIGSALVNGNGAIVTEAVLNLSDKLQSGKVYHLTVTGGITDAAGWNGIKTKEGNDPYTVTFAGTDMENAAPRITGIDAKDRHTFEIRFSEPVYGAENAPYELINETDGIRIPIRKGREAAYQVAPDRKSVTIFLDVEADSRLQSGKSYRLTYNVDSGTLSDEQGKRMEAKGTSAQFAGTDGNNARPAIARVLASGTSIHVTFSEPITGYVKQTDFFTIQVDGKSIQTSSGSIDVNTITLTVPKLTSGKLGQIKVSPTGAAVIRDYNNQALVTDWFFFGVQ